MAAGNEIVEIDKLNLDAELAMRRARRLLEWMRAVYENEAQFLTEHPPAPRSSSPEPREPDPKKPMPAAA